MHALMASPLVLKALSIKYVVRGYHVYKDIWNPTICKQFDLHVDNFNSHDRYVVVLDNTVP